MENLSSVVVLGSALIGCILLSVLIAWGILNLLFASAMTLHARAAESTTDLTIARFSTGTSSH